ncbi:phosphatase PAP2 family protein [Nonomuraea dietziae]|uniref:Undecaprenyl-diphosphatase n=1 Tax=Nonomuraea dietziae TaxID=65515 RepID=A0A7W5V632_9ACTN|nr:phosphatase PAP2 family protein [Nonomuraea dietziae]MBB3727970.1 undecaprenyl-diphosphatase [Nonomuraea dietziae]
MYGDIVAFAMSMPEWVHTLAEIGTDAGLLLFAALFAVAFWRARAAPDRDLALTLAGPFAVVAAYVLSEVVKLLIKEERPCRGGIATIAACPPVGDWSFPSNHAVIAAASAGALTLVWRRLAWLVLPLAALMAFSRVFVGVHYPHDVAIGYLFGVTMAPLLALLTVGAFTPLVRRTRQWLPPAWRESQAR